MVPELLKTNQALRCIECAKEYKLDYDSYSCSCGELLEVFFKTPPVTKGLLELWSQRRLSSKSVDRSGVWRYREAILDLPESELVTRGEGNTNLYTSSQLSSFTGIDHLFLKHEGENPTGSFKDRGMAGAATLAKMLGAKAVACASTGNTSASMASYAALAGIKPFVFLPRGKISLGKLSQALAYGAITFQIEGSFDDALALVQKACHELGIYLMNSVNPFRIEGQKAIVIEALENLGWEVPDWIVLPGGNLGNTSAFGKALRELKDWGLISRLPRIAVIQAQGANPFYQLVDQGRETLEPMSPETLATAIRIGNPVSWKKALRVIEESRGVVEQLSEAEIKEAKVAVDGAGIGAEPASCCSVGGLKKLRQKGVISKSDSVLTILTGHLLKDPDGTLSIHSELVPEPPVLPNRYEDARDLLSQFL
jgi:threonine synthase